MVTLLFTLLCTHGHPSLHSWSPFSALMVTLLCTHGHPSLHSWSPFSSPSSALMVTLLCTHGHPSLHSWSPFSALMVTLLCTHGHPSLHSWSPFSALLVTPLSYLHPGSPFFLLFTRGHPSLFSALMVTLCTHGHSHSSHHPPSLSPPSAYPLSPPISHCDIITLESQGRVCSDIEKWWLGNNRMFQCPICMELASSSRIPFQVMFLS